MGEATYSHCGDCRRASHTGLVGIRIDDEVGGRRGSTGLKCALLDWRSEDSGEMKGQVDRYEG